MKANNKNTAVITLFTFGVVLGFIQFVEAVRANVATWFGVVVAITTSVFLGWWFYNAKTKQ